MFLSRRRRFIVYIFILALLVQSFSLLISNYSLGKQVVYADQIDDLQKQIDDLAHLKKLSEDATTPLEQQVSDLSSRISAAQAGINQAKVQAQQVADSIQKRDATLGATFQIFAHRVFDQYKRSSSDWLLLTLLSHSSAQSITLDIEYQLKSRQQNQQQLEQLSKEILTFEQDKKDLEATQVKLSALQASLDQTATFFKGEISKAKAYQADLAGKIASLSQLQQSILAERTGTATTTVGDVPLADDPNSRPTYNPGFSPAFAAFSFGAPHFKGMSQYGAFGRAMSGQNAETILHAYYGNLTIRKDYPTNINIHVSGYDTVDIETYVKRIYEMPGSWGDQGGMEALKAQAVAARSYALATTNNGQGSICATESCQVYKPANKGGNWDAAVDATRGWVLIANGSPFDAWYASTSGGYQQSYTVNGYTTPGFWDTTSDWTHWAQGAYEVKAQSPWFYKGWYRDRSGDSCGRSSPWLTQSEFADILNAWVVRTHGSSDDVSHITPIGSCYGGNPWSLDQMRQKADSLGGSFTTISSLHLQHGNNGFTQTVILETNRGEVQISGSDFRTAFNLRAPGRISIKGNLFGIEQR